MKNNSKIFIAGHNGLVGSAITRQLKTRGYCSLILRSHRELDLTNSEAVKKFFGREKPECVILAAAKVGGIQANNLQPAEFIYSNLQIQNNVIQESFRNNVKKLLFLGSVCIYPKFAPTPVKESSLLSDRLEPTNEPYAIAKIAGLKMCQSYNRQYGTNFIGVMPTNLYGPGDNFDLNTSHVLPALIRKFHQAKIKNDKEVLLWGSGNAKREFLYVDDMARGCIFLMQKFNPTREQNECGEHFVNLGYGTDLTIRELAKVVKKIVGFEGRIEWDLTKPDGTPKRLLDSSKIIAMGWSPTVSLEKGIRLTYEWFKKTFREK